MKGLFITFEGTEGAGKSTQLRYLAEQLESKGLNVVVTREPGGTPLAEDIRQLLLNPAFKGMSVDAELLLMFAARAEHLHRVILPAIVAGKVVLCDRYTDATYAYQGGGRGVDSHKIAQLEQLIQGDFRPDLTLLFDVDVHTGLLRAGKRGALDRFEQEDIHFFNAVRHVYLERAKRFASRYRIIDANQPIDHVQKMVSACLIDILRKVNDN